MSNSSEVLQNLAGKHVLVTGGAGFIGSHLVDLLMQQGCYVRVLDNLVNGKKEYFSNHLESGHFEFIHGSVTDPFDVRDAVSGVEMIFHLACLGVRHSIKHPFENHRVNSEGTLLLLQEAKKQGIERFIYCSSSEVYGTALNVPMSEMHPTIPNTVYGASKLAGESYARSYYKTYKLPVVIVRPFNTYGPRSHHESDAGEFIPKSIVRALNNKSLCVFGDGSQTRDFTFVEDTVKGILLAGMHKESMGQTFNIGSQKEISILNLAQLILELLPNTSSKIEYAPSRPGDVLRLYADSQALKSLTDWSPTVTLQEGLLKTVQWFSSNGLKIEDMLQQEQCFNWK